MKRNFRLWLNAGLLAVVAALGLLAFYQPGVKDKGAEPPLLSTLKTEAVSRIELQRARQIMVLERRDAHWEMMQPYRIAADDVHAGLLLDFLSARSLRQFPVVSGDLEKYGLEPPSSVLIFNDQRFEFGSQHPLSLNRYVRLGDTVHLVTDIVNQHLIAEMSSYVSPRLLPENAGIASISTPGLRVEQQNGKLIATSDAASADTVARFIEGWRAARAILVRALSDEEKGQSSAEKIEITFADRGMLTFAILQREPALILARQEIGLAWEFAPDTGKGLLALEVPAEQPR